MTRPVAFISHSSRDAGVASSLASALRDLGIDIWIDHEQVRLGDSVPGRIEEGLSKADAILLLVSASYLQSRWCRAEYEPLLAREIESQRTYVIVLRLDDAELPLLLRAKRYVDFRSGITREALEELARDIANGVSYSRFERLVPEGEVGYRHSVLSMIIASTLREYPVSALGREAVLAGRSLIDLYRAVEALIERFQDLCDEIVQALVAGGVRAGDHQSVYGSAFKLGEAGLRRTNRKLSSIASDMREIASSLKEILPEGSRARERFGDLLQICATISVAEDFLVVEFGTPPTISLRADEEAEHWFPPAGQLASLDRHDSWDNSKKLDEYTNVLSQLDIYKGQLRREIARLASS
jgi:hypothetical protein